MKLINGFYTFRQSWVGDFMLCPERARRTMLEPDDAPDDGTDATALGTAAHHGIEQFLKGESWSASVSAANDMLRDMIRNKEFRWVQIKQPKTLLKYLNVCLRGWMDDVFPLIGSPMPGIGLEHEFAHQITSNIILKGTWDMLDEYTELWDWKTSGSNFALNYGPKALDKKIQPTLYSAVVAEWNEGSSETYDEIRFNYGIMIKGARPQGEFRTTVRGEGHWRWLVEQLRAIVKLYETLGPDNPWPMHDNEWHCSPEWCDHWTDCKGQFVTIRKR